MHADQSILNFEEHYSKVVRNQASVTLKITKCTTIGPPGIGKTCLKHLLTGQEWDVEVGMASTDVMEAPQWVECYSVVEVGAEGLWKLLSKKEQQGNLLRAVTTYGTSCSQLTTTPSPTTTSSGAQPTSAPNDAPLKTTPSDAQATTIPSAATPTTKPSDASSAPSPTTTAQRQVLQALEALSHLSHEELNDSLKDKEGKVLGETRLIHFIDTGGQAIYHDVHPVLITSPSIYLVVFSLEDFYQKSGEEQLHYFRSELIQRPLRSIYTLGTKKPKEEGYLELHPEVPKIFIVGTHLDKIHPDNRKKFLLKLHNTIFTEICNKPYRQFVHYDTEGRSFWAVDNTQAGREQDKTVKKYISALHRFIQQEPMEMSVKVPITWMLLKLAMDSRGVRYCRYLELLEEARIRGYVSEHSPDTDLDTMLRLFHILGLIYHKVPTGYKKEDSLVFIDPDCLYSATSHFLMAAKEETEGIQGGSSQGGRHQTEPAIRERCHGEVLGEKGIRQQKPEGIMGKNRVVQRMENHMKNTKHEMEIVLQHLEESMTIGQDHTEMALELLQCKYKVPSKEIRAAMSLREKRQMFIGRLVHSLLSTMKAVPDDSELKGKTHVMEAVGKALDNIRAQCQSGLIDSCDMDQFISILSDLRIVAQLSNSDSYVVPAALPKVPHSVHIAGSADSVLITIVSQTIMEVCYLPSGLFCCLISELVTGLGWTVIPLGRTHVTFAHESLAGKVHVMEHEAYIEIKLESDLSLPELTQTSQTVRRRIHESIISVHRNLFSDPTAHTTFEETLVWGFQCLAHPSDETHIAALQIDDSDCCAECLLMGFNALQPVTPAQLVWFSDSL